jgi:integrase
MDRPLAPAAEVCVFNEEVRDLDAVRLPRWGRVVAAEGAVPWAVVGSAGEQVEPIEVFLVEFVLRDNRVGSVRSYAYGLLRWWRWLRAIDVVWDRATPAEVRDFVLWLRRARKGSGAPRPARPARGSVNPITGKQYLDDRYKPRTIRHSNAVLRSFYEFWIERGAGPLINPVQLDHRGPGQRAHAHHNPLSPYLPEGRIRYNPKVPKRGPRAMSDERWADLFAKLRSNRDRAILALTISNGARASEVLGVRAMDLDWGDQRVRVFRKGSGAEQWLPAPSWWGHIGLTEPHPLPHDPHRLAHLGPPLSPPPAAPSLLVRTNRTNRMDLCIDNDQGPGRPLRRTPRAPPAKSPSPGGSSSPSPSASSSPSSLTRRAVPTHRRW